MNEHTSGSPSAKEESPAEEGLLSRLEVIESQPLEQRAAGFDQLSEELLTELQRSDNEGTTVQ